MSDAPEKSRLRLGVVRLVSSLWLVLAAGIAAAHDITPMLGDFSDSGGQLVLDLQLNAEVYLAGIDPDQYDTTTDSDYSDPYDGYRRMSPAALEPMLAAFAEGWVPKIGITADGTPVTLTVTGVEVPPTGNIAMPRTSTLYLTGALPPGAEAMVMTWPEGAGAVVLRQQNAPDPWTGYLESGQTSEEIPLTGNAAPGPFKVLLTYIRVGFDHIVPFGPDHILFVLGLFFFGTTFRPLLWQVTAFTLAHSVTLAMGVLGRVEIPGAFVEPLIALSICYVAVENLWPNDRLSRFRPVVIFGFGLLHGLGFASVLESFGLPQNAYVPALAGFNLGVEFGQLAVISAAYLAVGYWFWDKPWYRARIAIPASVVIAAVGAYWFIERTLL
ncbi:HupE/UreJ family protein [Chachezhania antarctica]|uniref:HupE/UreJ family protein n=1 Tax=Chachezhania antarctica TaxID=2340860 RepID=UPI000EB3FA3D|nr:HupE/UreJ family protein [Chachezhania antarctica]